MAATTPARRERHELCDLFDALGPDEPTLCAGWTTRDLAAHLVVRERRPDAGLGIVWPAFAGHTERLRRDEAAHRYAEIVERVRSGPPRWSPMHFEPIDAVTNSVEFFVHHEDVRRAQPDWTARQLDDDLVEAITPTALAGRMLTRRAGVGIVVAPTGGSERDAAQRRTARHDQRTGRGVRALPVRPQGSRRGRADRTGRRRRPGPRPPPSACSGYRHSASTIGARR